MDALNDKDEKVCRHFMPSSSADFSVTDCNDDDFALLMTFVMLRFERLQSRRSRMQLATTPP